MDKYDSVFRNLRTVREMPRGEYRHNPKPSTGWLIWAVMVFALFFCLWHLDVWGL